MLRFTYAVIYPRASRVAKGGRYMLLYTCCLRIYSSICIWQHMYSFYSQQHVFLKVQVVDICYYTCCYICVLMLQVLLLPMLLYMRMRPHAAVYLAACMLYI